MDYERANPLQRALRRFASSGAGSWFFARVLHHLDKPVYVSGAAAEPACGCFNAVRIAARWSGGGGSRRHC